MRSTIEADAVQEPIGPATPDRLHSAPTLAVLKGGLRRGWPIIALTSLLGLAGGLAVVANTTSTYTATSAISTEQQRVRIIQDAYTFSGEEGSYESDAGTQVELLRSTNIASIVAETQRLAPNKVNSAATVRPKLSKVLVNFGLEKIAERIDPKPVEQAADERLIRDVKEGLGVRRIPRTAIIEISYTSNDPAHATRMANAFAEAYIEYNRRNQRNAARSAASWLRDRLAELRDAVQDTEQSIQSYKAKRGFVATEGRLIEEQRLGEANRQLLAAQAETSNARVRFAKLKSAVAATTIDGVPAEFLGDPLLSQLRNRYVQADISERSLAAKLGARHDAVTRLRQQKSDVERQLRTELERMAGSIHGQIELAQAREEAIRREYQELARLTTQSNEAQIELRELERRNDAYKSLYSTILQKYQSAINQQSLTEVPARMINRAMTPSTRSSPSPLRVISFGLLLGAALGSGLVAARALMDHTLRTRSQALSQLGVGQAWLLPSVPSSSAAGASSGDDGVRQLRPTLTAFLFAQRNPGSYFAGTLDAIRLEIAGLASGRAAKVGIVSLLDAESSSFVAKNLASLTAATGARTLLIDADLANASLSRKTAAGAKTGLAGAILKTEPVEDLVFTESETGLRMLPSVAGESARRPADLLSSSSMRALVDQLATGNDCMVFAMPPIGRGVDSQALLPHLDAVVLVVQWGRTPIDVISDALDYTPGLAERCLGVVLMGANPKVARQYGETDIRSCAESRS